MNTTHAFIKRTLLVLIGVVLSASSVRGVTLEKAFQNPPNDCKPWVFWFWINGNISKEGITKDLESMKRVGINGVLWMEVSGTWWAPPGKVQGGTPEWREMMQWAISEADRLDMDFALSVDFGYGCGGPHITPDKSMQKLVWSETSVKGGGPVSVQLKKPNVDYRHAVRKASLRPGETLVPKVLNDLEQIDSYRDVAVFAIKGSIKERINARDQLEYDGRGWKEQPLMLDAKKIPTPIPNEQIIYLTGKMDSDGKLNWSAPAGEWTVIRFGHSSNFKMTRPSPRAAVGLEADRLNSAGMTAHFENHLKPIIEGVGDAAGRTLQYIHIDSWEAKGQNWSDGFAEEFKKRRRYEITPWLPAFVGIPVESAELTSRFFWDVRQTVSELMLDNYIDRLRELAKPYGIGFSCEPFGHFCVDPLTYSGRADFPIAEFWTKLFHQGKDDKLPSPKYNEFDHPAPRAYRYYQTIKAQASAANTYGKSRVGAEAFTGTRGWGDHPWLIKNMGDQAFAFGINHYIYHLSAHQAYDNLIPGLTHRKWGQHFNRYQTWWDYSKPYFDYVARCQLLLQQGTRVADIAWLHREGAPTSLLGAPINPPTGYDYDWCSSEIIQRMEYKNGRIRLPSGANYRYLLLPESGRLTLKTAQKVEALRKAGASIIQSVPVVGTPGLENYPTADKTVKELASAWSLLPAGGWEAQFAADKFAPDFIGRNIRWTHRHADGDDIYFVANAETNAVERDCSFRVTGKTAELWDPETGTVYALPDAKSSDGRTTIRLKFDDSQSWFVVFRDKPTAKKSTDNPFPVWKPVQEITGEWSVRFDPKWGSDKTLYLDALQSWSEQTDPLVKYYSGTGTYQTSFDVERSVLDGKPKLFLDLGTVKVVARVTLNGKLCGTLWKPPFRVDISDAIKEGKNELKVDVANTWLNRMVGDEQLPQDSEWHNFQTLKAWPDWFKNNTKRASGRKTFTTAILYTKDSPLRSSGLLGPVQIGEQK